MRIERPVSEPFMRPPFLPARNATLQKQVGPFQVGPFQRSQSDSESTQKGALYRLVQLVRIHKTVHVTPMAAGLTHKLTSMRDVIAVTSEHGSRPGWPDAAQHGGRTNLTNDCRDDDDVGRGVHCRTLG
jgi:hypothetical protein